MDTKTLKLIGEANSLLRSAYDIALRKGDKVNWSAFKKNVHKALLKQHTFMKKHNMFDIQK